MSALQGQEPWLAGAACIVFACVLAGLLGWAAHALPRRIAPEFVVTPGPVHRRRRHMLLAVSPACALGCFWAFQPLTTVLAATTFVLVLLALAWIDAECGLLPDLLTQPLLWLGLLFNLNGAFVPLPDAVLGAVSGYGVLACVYWVFLLGTGREGLGRGDLKLLAALGAWLGWMSIPWLLLISAGLGLALALGLRLKGQLAAGQGISFGPFLAVAGILVLFTPTPPV